MVAITAQMVKELREKTGAGLVDCKKALTEVDGEVSKAIDVIRKMGLAKLDKKSHRTTNQGHVTAIVKDDVAILAEILCETDFVAKNAKFTDYVAAVSGRAADGDYPEGDIAEQVKAAESDALGELIASCGENIQVRRIVRWKPNGTVHSYIHDGGGSKIGVIVEVEGDHDEEYGKFMAMHIAASSPDYICPDDIPEDVVTKEKEIAAAQPDMAGKPADIIEKILIGRIRKWQDQVCLTRQTWVHDDKTQVEKVNPNAKVLRYLRWQVGEEL